MADNGMIQAIMRAATAQSQPIDPATIQALEAVKILSAPAKLSNPSHSIQLPATVKSVDDGVITLASRLGNIQIETSTQLRAGQMIILSVTADGKLAEALAPMRNTGQSPIRQPVGALSQTDLPPVVRAVSAAGASPAGRVQSALPGITLSPMRSFQLPAEQIAGQLKAGLPIPPGQTRQLFQPGQTIIPADQLIGAGAKIIQSMTAGLASRGNVLPGKNEGINATLLSLSSTSASLSQSMLELQITLPSNHPVGQALKQLSYPSANSTDFIGRMFLSPAVSRFLAGIGQQPTQLLGQGVSMPSVLQAMLTNPTKNPTINMPLGSVRTDATKMPFNDIAAAPRYQMIARLPPADRPPQLPIRPGSNILMMQVIQTPRPADANVLVMNNFGIFTIPQSDLPTVDRPIRAGQQLILTQMPPAASLIQPFTTTSGVTNPLTAMADLTVADFVRMMTDRTGIQTDGGLPASPPGLPPLANLANPAGVMPALLLFLTLLRRGNPQNWMKGDMANQLARTLGLESGERIADLFRGATTRLTDGPPGDWRMAQIPIALGEELTNLRLSYRDQDTGGGDPDDRAEGIQFLIDLTFDRVGPLRLDGYVAGKRFDLAVITAQPVEALGLSKAAIINRFERATGATGLNGQLVFRASIDKLKIEDMPHPYFE